MQPERTLDAVQASTIGPAEPVAVAEPVAMAAGEGASTPEPPRPSNGWWRWAALAAGVIVLLGAGVWVWLAQHSKPAPIQASDFKETKVPLDKLSVTGAVASAQSLRVNGDLEVSNTLTLTPSSAPTAPITGQFYYDKATNRPLYYNGTQFVDIQGDTIVNNNSTNQVTNLTNNPVNNNITNVTNVINGGGGGFGGTAVVGSLAMFTSATTIGASLLSQTGQAVVISNNGNAANTVAIDAGTGVGGIQIGNSATNHNIQVGTGAGTQTVAVGSGSGASTTTIQGGTGGLDVATGAAAGVTGNLSIRTGNSSTTASGNIDIDTGSGVVSGLVIEHKTFESGLENMNSWFNSTIAQSTAQAHSGANSLAATATAANWGIIETLPGVSVTPGHQYFISVWVRAATTSRSIIGKVAWVGGTGTVSLTPIADNNTGWTEMTALAPAPAGSTSAYFEIQALGTNGEVHYFDDMTVTDLSSSTAASVINLGNTNAKIITIGNLNQLGATTINGGSGIALNSGAAGTTINGGTVDITGNAASSFTTTAGALTLTSNATATWGIGTPGSGAGGDLTLRAGHGGTDTNNDGGDLFLQGGRQNGTGAPGSVILKPQVDSADAFQMQDTAGSTFFTADTASHTITIKGTDTSFASLTVTDAHVKSTQTTPPTIGTPAACGTTPVAAVTAGSTDTAGSFTITTGTGGTSATCDAVVTFHQPYGAAPKSIIVVGKTDAASAARQIYVSAVNATTFTVSFGASAAGANSTPYSFSYWVIE